MKILWIIACWLFVVAVNGDTFKQGTPLGQKRGGRVAENVEPLIGRKCTKENIGKTFCATVAIQQCDAIYYVICTGYTAADTTATPQIPEAFHGRDFDILPGQFCYEATDGNAEITDTLNAACTGALTPSDFKCNGKGVFPDPLDCRKYYFCAEDEGTKEITAKPYICEDKYVFDPSGPNGDHCRWTNGRFCTENSCEKPGNFLLNYQFFPKSKGQYIVNCRSSGKAPYVFRCGAGFEPNLRTLPVQCTLKCTRAEKLPDADDQTKYHECVRIGNSWVHKPRECYRGYTFDARRKMCIPK